ncbi:MAG: hypothetical protein MUE55_03345 [Thermoplasmata archaeon]|nr:hypothetical protein [Thermoplasmata archaeon]
MKVCIPCTAPGGPETVIATPFEETDFLDYYEVHPDGRFEHLAQMRNCGGGTCVDPVEAIIHRGVDKVVVTSLTPSSLLRFHNAGVEVLRTDDPTVRGTLDLLARGGLKTVTIDEYAKLERTRK